MGKLERAFSAAFGLLLLGVGVYALFFGQEPAALRIGGGIVFVLFGANLLYASCRRKPSWLSRIGPLP